MTITRNLEGKDLMVFIGSEVVTRPEFDEAKKYTIAHIKEHGTLRVLIIITEDFVGLESFASWHDTQADEFIQQHISRLAIVGSSKWSEDAMLFFLGGLLPFPIQYFKSGEDALARAWLQS
jgi:hypothetical protein